MLQDKMCCRLEIILQVIKRAGRLITNKKDGSAPSFFYK
jgi:hypothetical protein